ncbi:MAG: murein hydrolase activator EnvC family protein [Paracoccaceae bacterium]
MIHDLRHLAIILCSGLLLSASSLSARDTLQFAQQNVKAFEQATAELITAQTSKDRIRGLTKSIRAVENALSIVRENLRVIAKEKAEINARLFSQEENISQLLGVIHGIDKEPAPARLIHPQGPLTTARAGMLLADILPKLQAPVERLRDDLAIFEEFERLQEEARAVLKTGLSDLQKARTDLSVALANRGPLPKRFTEDPSKTALLVNAVNTLSELTENLSLIAVDEVDGSLPDISARKGRLPFPAYGRILRRFGERDAAGIQRSGLLVATEPETLVISPTAATLRFKGQVLDYGLVAILEPQTEILFVFSGLEKIFGNVGEVIPSGTPFGQMGGISEHETTILDEASVKTGSYRSETLYIEVRERKIPQDPLEWFQVTWE